MADHWSYDRSSLYGSPSGALPWRLAVWCLGASGWFRQVPHGVRCAGRTERVRANHVYVQHKSDESVAHWFTLVPRWVYILISEAMYVVPLLV